MNEPSDVSSVRRHYTDRPQVVDLSQVQHLLDDLGCGPIGRVLGNGLAIGQSGFTGALEGRLQR